MRRVFLSDILESALIPDERPVALYDKHCNIIVKCDSDELRKIGNVIKESEVISLDIGGLQRNQIHSMDITLNMSLRLLPDEDIAELVAFKKLVAEGA